MSLALFDIFDQAPWRLQAACRGVDPEIFASDLPEMKKTAKKICADCPVRDECLEYALANKEEGGIWGGLTHNQRVRLKKARAKGLSLV
jgi:WhiB family redox-sensing transcriptional regulator